MLDSGEQDGRHYLVTEFVEGMNLAQLLRSGPMRIADAVHLMTQVCDAITYAHENGIVHRDIKPANIVVSGDRAKVLIGSVVVQSVREAEVVSGYFAVKHKENLRRQMRLRRES